jgi:mxaJ protein
MLAAPLRICADPDNLPFSNQHQQGFENRIGSLLAKDLGRDAVFVWARSRRGFLREQFNKDACDVLMGVPEGMRGVSTTVPYYRSSYVFVTPSRDHLRISSFSDPHLNGRRIGLQILEEDFAPPSLPLIRAGHAAQLVGFSSFGEGGANLVRAVADGRVGTAVIWGPVAGYYTASQHLPLTLAPVSPAVVSGVPFTYALAAGVHRGDNALRDALNSSIERLQPRIDRILASYHVPTLPLGKGAL